MENSGSKPKGFNGLLLLGDELLSPPRVTLQSDSSPATMARASEPLRPKAPVSGRLSGIFGTWTVGAKLGLAFIVLVVGMSIWQGMQPPQPLSYSEPVYSGSNDAVLGFSELCWCRREGLVLDTAKSRIGSMAKTREYNTLVDIFNARVSRFNAKCGRAKYRVSDSQALDQRSPEISSAATMELNGLLAGGF